MADRLDALAAEVRESLRKLGEPAPNWPATPSDCDADVLIVGAGQSGIAAAFGLMRIGVRNIRVVSADPIGREGPWRTIARMPTLRSPKQAPGPELGLPALAYESWHVARYGQASYDALDLIPTGHWADYIDWVRAATGIAVTAGWRMTGLAGMGDRVVARFEDGASLAARQVVLATGMDALGGPRRPHEFANLPEDRALNAYADIDFSRLEGERIAVIGAASTAFDNAAAALEAGAASVDLFCRGPKLKTINHMKGVQSYGAVAHWADFDDAARWRFAILGASRAAPPTGPTVARATRWPNFRILLNAAVEGVEVKGGSIRIATAGRARDYDRLIVAAGYALAPDTRPELAAVVKQMARWRDRYVPPADLRNDDLAAYPYLDPGFAFTERDPGAAPWLARVRLFAGPAVVSMGRISGESGNLKYGVPRLVQAIARALAEEDRDCLYDRAAAYAVPETDFADYADHARDAGSPD